MEKKDIVNDDSFYCVNCGGKLTSTQDVCLKCGAFVKRKNYKNRKGKDKRANFSLVEVIVITLITGILVATLTGIVVYNNYDKINKNDTTIKENEFEEIEKAYKQIMEEYFNKVDPKGLSNAAIEGMYNYLGDPYSSFLDETNSKELRERLDGEFFGMGIEFATDEKGHEIKNVFEGGPASKAGLLVGDIIIKLNGEDVTGISASEVAAKIKYSNISAITITVLRGEEEITKDITLSKVTIPSVTSNIYDKTGYIKLSTFASNSLDQFKEHLKELEDKKINSLIIDLRGNGGGLLNSASDIASLFIEKGKKIYGLQSGSTRKFYTDKTNDKRNYKVVVLIDGASASASEILAAALKESYGATLIGSTSYGKGTVQETSDLSSGAMVKFTTGYWLTPNGNNINAKGLTPDIVVDNFDNIIDIALEAVK